MSIIVGYATEEEVVLGYDSQVTSGNIGRSSTLKKAFKKTIPLKSTTTLPIGYSIKDNTAIGVVGMPVMVTKLMCRFRPPLFEVKHFTEKQALLDQLDEYMYGLFIPKMYECIMGAGIAIDTGNDSSEIIVGAFGHLWSVDSMFNSVRFDEPYDAIGSGAEMALGILDVLNADLVSPVSAVKITVDFVIDRDVMCGGESRLLVV